MVVGIWQLWPESFGTWDLGLATLAADDRHMPRRFLDTLILPEILFGSGSRDSSHLTEGFRDAETPDFAQVKSAT